MDQGKKETLYSQEDFQVHGNLLVVKYFKVVYNRHKHGFEKGVIPLLEYCKQNKIDTVLLDLEETTHIESVTLGSIVRFKKQINEVGVQNIRLYNPSPEAGEAIIMQNLDQLFGMPYYSLEEAIKELKK